MICTRRKKAAAWFFLLLVTVQTLSPAMVYALTSGPVQPEMQQFQPAGTTDLVDVFSGDFKYNIPLLDVGGYPMNLAYQSGMGMEDEASWVGMGWSLNPGAINRELRGLPDDFNGDKITKQYNRKPFVKIGAQVILKPSILSWEFGSASIKTGIYKDNYYGIGAEVGASVGFQVAKNRKTELSAGLGITSDSRNGLSISPSMSIAQGKDSWHDEPSRSLTGSFEYNTRAGLKSVSLGASFSTTGRFKQYGLELSAAKYYGQSYTPSIKSSTKSNSYTLSFDFGPSIWGGYVGIGGSGYYYEEGVDKITTSTPGFGYMNYLSGRKNQNALLDFNREKDGVFIPSTPAIPVPVATQDLFSVTGQAGSFQFRPYFSGNYVVFDQFQSNTMVNAKAGVTVGVGNLYKSGGRIDLATGGAYTKKWTKNNQYLDMAEASFNVAGKPDEEAVFLKQTGELTQTDELYSSKIKDDKTVTVAINDLGHPFQAPKAYAAFKSREDGRSEIGTEIKRTAREKRTTVVSYLTAGEAKKYALDKERINQLLSADNYRANHHIAEVTLADNTGKRMVYGIPVYNVQQQDVTFSVQQSFTAAQLEQARRTGLTTYVPGFDNSANNKKGRDRMFSRSIVPGYASSFLLTAVLSPDYVDVTGDGVTDDDLGTAVKFNYTRLSQAYKWRAPYARNTANYNEGFISDPKDDKGSYAFGVKEVWYLESVESKTMIAYFETSNRQDGLGVLDENGGQNGTVRLKKLDRIKLYSKADLIKNTTAAIPIKVVHFEYDYSLTPGLPNNLGEAIDKNGSVPATPEENVNKEKGKLTLRKVYFTFGQSTRAQSNPYEFLYDTRLVKDVFPGLPVPFGNAEHAEAKNAYAQRQADRWGTYKPSWYNHLTGNPQTDGTLNNSEFPYTLQENNDGNTSIDYSERELSDFFASKWQLNKIITPTGSVIELVYEADDYAYVQDRRAMQMCHITGVGNVPGQSNGMIDASGFRVELPEPVVNNDINVFKKKYLQGSDGQLLNNIFYKVYTDIDNRSHMEYVQGYAEIDVNNCTVNGSTAFIALKKLNGHNPVSAASWQMLKADLPQYAFDGYDNSDATTIGQNYIAAIKSLVQAFLNMREAFRSFEGMAASRFFADKVDVSRSMIRLYNPGYKKTGGGCRVKKLLVRDEWANITNGVGKSASYGQLYKYETTGMDGVSRSTGVAAYEPQIGNEENPFREPVNFTQKVHWSRDQYHYVEKPFCETYFPAAAVGYSKVTVIPVGDEYIQTGNLKQNSGYTEYEFYTAFDFPTLVDYLPLDNQEIENSLLLKLFTATYYKRVATSQGFKVEINDMHGKPKSVKVFSSEGSELSSVQNYYQVTDENAQQKKLNNYVDILNADGSIKAGTLIGNDVDLVTDVRESANENFGVGIGAYKGGIVTGFPLFPFIPYGSIVISPSISTDAYHSVSTVKVVHKYGILKKVISVMNGSSISAENLLWDGETGEVLLTKNQNGFDDYTYAFHYPAYLAPEHEGMQGSYRNAGAYFENVIIGADGVLPAALNPYLSPGDELGLVNNNSIAVKGWVIRSVNNQYKLVDAKGDLILVNGSYKILRSGRRNLTSASAGTVICMNNPVIDIEGSKQLQIDVDKKILDANAVVYKNEWSVPVIPRKGKAVFCETIYPFFDAHWPSNFMLYNNPDLTDCYGNFGVLAQGTNKARGFLDFGNYTLPAGATLVSAKLSLFANRTYADATVGANDSYLSRLLDRGFCSSALTWTNQPPVSTSNTVAIPASTSAQQDYTGLDITGMFNEWYTTRDVSRFMVRIALVNEGSIVTLVTKKMLFYGVPGDAAHNYKPQIEVCYTMNDVCADPVGQILNPYVQGVLGNWRAERSFAYTVNREQKRGLNYLPGSTDIRKSGYYAAYAPFWTFLEDGGLKKEVNVDDAQYNSNRWVWSSRPVYYDYQGNEIEHVDALQRYNAALFGYQEALATAVGTNARRNEIAFEGFEDYNFSLNNSTSDCPVKRHFDWGLLKSGNAWCASGGCLVTEKAHSGRYSYRLDGYANFQTAAGAAAAQPASLSVLGYDIQGRYKLLANEAGYGFRPVPGKKYLLSMWVYDGSPATNTISGLTVRINGQDRHVETLIVPVVEKWKRLEIAFDAAAGLDLQLQKTGGTIYIDDFRIVPENGQLTSFVYDETTMRLMAQLDENNFATFYEYDEEGTPVRVKKETERGIMTLKENRQSFRQR